MKGMQPVATPAALAAFIAGLDALASRNFPVQEVTTFLQATRFEKELLEPYSFFSEKRYTRNLLHKRPEYEILLLCWMPHQVSPIHGHEGEKCWMRVEAGELHFTDYESREEGGRTLVEARYSAIGTEGFVDGPAVIHRVANETNLPAMSLHLYARPFAQCDVFDKENHLKKKIDLSYDSMHGQLTNTVLF